MSERRAALMFVCPWLTEGDADAILAGEGDRGPTLVERLAHHETEHRAWEQVAMELWREATGSDAPWPGSAKAVAEVRAARSVPASDARARAIEQERDAARATAGRHGAWVLVLRGRLVAARKARARVLEDLAAQLERGIDATDADAPKECRTPYWIDGWCKAQDRIATKLRALGSGSESPRDQGAPEPQGSFMDACPRCDGVLVATDSPGLVVCEMCERRWPPRVNWVYPLAGRAVETGSEEERRGE